jgi:hypothetical protein
MTKPADALQTLVQALAIAGLAVIWAMIVHKGYADISLIANQHSGAEFWSALARYLVGNIAGGAKLAGS